MAKTRSFDWLSQIFNPLAIILMEAFWVYSWLLWTAEWPMFQAPRPPLGLLSVIIVLGAALLAIRTFARQKWSLRTIRVLVLAIGFIVMLLVLGVEYRAGFVFFSGAWLDYIIRTLKNTFSSPSSIVFAIPALLYLWWRGVNMGKTATYFRDVYRSFIIGLVAFIVLIILWQITSAAEGIDPPGAGIGLNVLAFFFFGLTAVAITHLYEMRRSMPKEEAALTSVRRWLPITLGLIGSMVAVVFGLANVFSEDFFESVGHGAGVVFNALGKAFEYILIPFNFIFDAIFRFLRWILSLLRPEDLQPPQENGDMQPLPTPDTTSDLPVALVAAIKWMVIILIAALVVFILYKAVSRIRGSGHRDDIEEIHESLWSWRGLRDDLRLLFGMMGSKFRRKPAAVEWHQAADDSRLDVREIYRNLQWEGSRSGMARRRHETAAEYTSRLSRRVPESGEPLNDLTELYGAVRYGEQEPTEQRIDDANVVWRTLRGLFRRFRRE